MPKKRKTTTSYEVKRRYDLKTYKPYNIRLRYDEDAELIRYIDEHKDQEGTTEIFRTALAEYIKEPSHE